MIDTDYLTRPEAGDGMGRENYQKRKITSVQFRAAQYKTVVQLCAKKRHSLLHVLLCIFRQTKLSGFK